jgi:molybdopterin converting factor small subunit
MNVGVRYLAQLRRLAGRSAEQVALPEPYTTGHLVAVLAERYPALRPALLDEQGQPRRSVLVFVGDEQVNLDRPLGERDEVTFLTPIAGGR